MPGPDSKNAQIKTMARLKFLLYVSLLFIGQHVLQKRTSPSWANVHLASFLSQIHHVVFLKITLSTCFFPCFLSTLFTSLVLTSHIIFPSFPSFPSCMFDSESSRRVKPMTLRSHSVSSLTYASEIYCFGTKSATFWPNFWTSSGSPRCNAPLHGRKICWVFGSFFHPRPPPKKKKKKN